MKLKSILENKVSQFKQGTQEHEVVGWLNHKADEIIQLASSHLKHVPNVFKEFDVHDAEHSENVLSIIEYLLGDEAEKLSSYDLFSLIAVSYLHDCGMAVSDYEMKVMDLVEKEEFDGIKSKPSEAKDAIIKYKKDICGKRSADFEGEIRNWLFVPEKKDNLIDYFAKLFLDYQDYRNGKREEIKKSDDLEQTNRDERLNYLRLTHHERVEKYIKNWGTSIFKSFPGGNGQKLADTIAQCCLAHGKSMSYIENDLKELTNVMYYGSEASNLQFISIMLRLGDLIDYSCKRAHPILRALHQFKSDFSFDQWRIKDENALSFSVKNGKVACVANCKTPRDYYKICDYVSQIDEELESYIRLNKENKWNDYPKSISESVNRKNLSLDDRYDPVPGLRFVLDQKNVLKLLTGANLYPNKYACLRELYQNSLDACRCQIAKDRAVGKSLDGKILFGLGEEEGRKFVYCLDNGKGMSKDIIQKYVLHIGTSYYSSQEFSKEKVKNKADFKPTSQFGIGLLSCFMIGDEIVITTLEEGGELISCGIDEPNECFYYINKPSDFDKEMVSQYSSGTLVKIFLNDKYQDLLNDDPLESLGYLLWFDYQREYQYDDNLKEIVKQDIDRWEHHLYHIMNDFIIVVQDGIEVNIELQNIGGGKKPIMIYPKPLPIIKELQPYAIINREVDDRDKSAFEEFKKRDYLDIHVKSESLEFRSIIELGKRDKSRIGLNGGDRCCVDGIGIGKYYYPDSTSLFNLFNEHICVINFIGENRPQLSVSRDKLMDTSLSEYEDDARILIEKLIKKSIEQVCKYIKDKAILPINPLYQIIWHRLSDKYSEYSQLFYRCLMADANCCDLQLPFTKIEMTFGELLKEDERVINKSMLNEACAWRFVIPRLLGSECIELNTDNNLIAKGHVELPKAVDTMSLVSNYLLFHPIDSNKCWNEYDVFEYSKGFYFLSDILWKNIRRDVSNDDSKNVIKDCWAYSQEYVRFFWFLRALFLRLYSIKMDSTKEIFIIVLDQEIGKQFYNNLEGFKGVEYLGLMTYVQDFSVLAFSKLKSEADDEIDNEESICFARRGKCSRQELLDSITDEWKDKIKNVLFPDGTIWNPDSSN